MVGSWSTQVQMEGSLRVWSYHLPSYHLLSYHLPSHWHRMYAVLLLDLLTQQYKILYAASLFSDIPTFWIWDGRRCCRRGETTLHGRASAASSPPDTHGFAVFSVLQGSCLLRRPRRLGRLLAALALCFVRLNYRNNCLPAGVVKVLYSAAETRMTREHCWMADVVQHGPWVGSRGIRLSQLQKWCSPLH